MPGAPATAGSAAAAAELLATLRLSGNVGEEAHCGALCEAPTPVCQDDTHRRTGQLLPSLEPVSSFASLAGVCVLCFFVSLAAPTGETVTRKPTAEAKHIEQGPSSRTDSVHRES